ncbi:MAG: right-handed parallel beta-helix repeat-containing protein [Bacteroidetes bacterium]|nr:right-handed parallel beta-helix repeat-containing protein [Bacteroidota bacterium]
MRKITISVACSLLITAVSILACITTNAAIVFSKDNSPYNITEDIVITNNDTIIISAGTTLIISPSINITTNGAILIFGVPEDPVLLLPEFEGIGWGKIEINCPGKTSIINNASIVDGTIFSQYCDMALDNATFINNQNLAWNNPVVFVINASVKIVNSSIYGNNTGEGFQMLNSETVIVKNCFFSKIPDAVELTNITGGYVSHNWFENILDDAIDLNNCTNTIIDSNIIINAVDRGIELGSENNGNSENIIVRRNVLVGCGIGIILKEESYGQVINNTFYGNNIGVSCIEDNGNKTGSFMNVQNCIFYNSIESDVFKDLNSTLITDYCISNSEVLPGEHNIFGDPLFINAAGNDFNLQENSPCINAGNPELPLDPDNSVSDIGAFFYNTDTTSLSERDMLFNSVEIYPNPFYNDFEISVKSKDPVTIELFNLSGVEIPAILEMEQSSRLTKIRVIPISKLKSNMVVICRIFINGYSKSYLLIHR